MDDIIKKKFGERIKQIRKIKGITQEQLSENIGINTRQMARIEAGESFVTSETLYKICKFLNIQPKILFDFEIQNKLPENNLLNDKQYKKILKKLDNLINNSQKLEFVEIAIDSINSKSSLEKLKLFIKGIELNNNAK